MSYLSRLHHRISGNRAPTPLTELTKAASVGSVSARDKPSAEIDVAERAAFIEHDGGIPRTLAEALAHLGAHPWPAWCEASRWEEVVLAFARMIEDGAAAQALATGWVLADLIGVQVPKPHDQPLRAGVVFSLRPGDAVTDVRRAGCIIAYGTVRHIWKRYPLPADGSICLPWDLAPPLGSRVTDADAPFTA